MSKRLHGQFPNWPRILLPALLMVALAAPVAADLTVVAEKVIGPKAGRVMANPGPVNRSAAVRMVRARVDIVVGSRPARPADPVEIHVAAIFTMTNLSTDALALTVGFPVSNSQYSAFALRAFTVETDGTPRAVFNRVSSYPRRRAHRQVSGPGTYNPRALPDVASTRVAPVFPRETIGSATHANLMVWEEDFTPHQTRTVSVRYAIAIPAQTSVWQRKQVKGNHKGIWPQEANNVPLDFLGLLPGGGSRYFFFDYYLTSGAAWAGTIGEEVVRLRLHPSWKGVPLYNNRGGRLVPADNGLTYVYGFRDADPVEDLYFALPHP